MTGALAVVVSVIYLAFQIRANTRATAISVVQNSIDAFSELDRLVASTPDLAHIILRGRVSIVNLSPEEMFRFDSYYSMAFQVLEGAFMGSQKMTNLPKEQVEVTEIILRNHFRHPGVRELWAKTKDEYPKDFANWMDKKGATQTDPS